MSIIYLGLFNLLAPPKKPEDQIMLPHRSPFYKVVVDGNSSNVTLRVEGDSLCSNPQHGSDQTSPGVLTIVRATSWGRSPRTSASRPGTTHGVSTSMDGGARGCPVSDGAFPLRGTTRFGMARYGTVQFGSVCVSTEV